MSCIVASRPRLSVVGFCILGLIVSLSAPALCELAPDCTMACCVAKPAPMCGTNDTAAMIAGNLPTALIFQADLETQLVFDLEPAQPANARLPFCVIAPAAHSATPLARFSEPRASLRRLHVILDTFRI